MSINHVAIIIPAYNESITIEEVVERYHKAYPEASIYVIDNNSSDNTFTLASNKLSQLGCMGKVIQEKRQGKGNALRLAFLQIEADYYVIVDADLTYSETELSQILSPVMNEEADMVVGDRHSSGDYTKVNSRLFHDFGNNLVKVLINFLFNSNLKDIMSGYRAFNRSFVKHFPIASQGFEIETEMTLHALDKRCRIKEIPITYVERPDGSVSKLNTTRDGIKIIHTIFNIFKDYKPLSFFGFLSVMFLLGGLGVGVPVLLEFYATRYIEKVPSAILASGLIVIAILLFGIGLILEALVKHYRATYQLLVLNNKSKN